MKAFLLATLLVLIPVPSLSLSPHQAPDPSEMLGADWAGDFKVILCYEGGECYMYRVERLPYQFMVHGSGWQRYTGHTFDPRN